MRVWLVPYRELDNKRLVAQHHEAHMLWGHCVEKYKNWPIWGDPAKYAGILEAHDLAVTEMLRRGGNHRTPIDILGELDYKSWDKLKIEVYSKENIRKDRWDLLCRWQGEYKGWGEMPGDYFPLLWDYRKTGCIHKVNKYGMCSICKSAILYNDKWYNVPYIAIERTTDFKELVNKFINLGIIN